MRFRNKKRRALEIAPDEIFLDASNAPSFDRGRFEGRLERPLSRGAFAGILVALGALFALLLARSLDLEWIRGAAFAAESAHNNLATQTVFAPRGVIVDRFGTVLADNVELPDGSVRRQYALPSMGPIIGYVSYPKKDANGNYYDTVTAGVAGLEAAYNDLLSGTNGKILVERDALGAVRSQGAAIPAKAGGTLALTVDANLESVLAGAIARVAKENGFSAGAGVIMDIHTGEVRAIASYPSYDPNALSGGAPASVIDAYVKDPGRPFLDHAVQGVYAPGSIVKPLISAGALTDGLITPSTVIDDTGALSIPDPYHPGKQFIYKGWRALGPVAVRQAIAWSSDVFFYTIGGGFGSQKGLGIDRLDEWYRRFGLGSPTGIDLPGEAAGRIPSPAWKEAAFGEPWYLGDTYFTAIGQYSMQVTPIQMARAAAAIASGGMLPAPHLVLDPRRARSTAVGADPSALAEVRAGMRESVTGALARGVDLPYLAVAAKTGTAQVGAHNEFDTSWVEGFFPYDAPEYSFAVVLERGPSGTGESAVEVMREAFDELYAAHSAYTGGAPSAEALHSPSS